MKSMKKVLITGSNGLLGSALGRIIENPILHTREEADLMNRAETSLYLLDNKPTTIIHCGAKVGGVLANMENNKQFFRVQL